jgi:hypothetical protein
MRIQSNTFQRIRPVVWAVVAFAVTVSIAPIAKSAELNPAHVPSDAKWLIHIDQDALADLEAMEELRELYPRITSRIQKWFKNRYGIDPQKDLRSVTMFSRDYRIANCTVLLDTDYDKEKIQTALKESDSLKQTDWKGHTLYTVTLAEHHNDFGLAARQMFNRGQDSRRYNGGGKATDDNRMVGRRTSDEQDESGGKQMTVYLGEEMILLTSSVPNAKSVLRLLEGDASSLEGTKSPLIAEAPADAMIYAAAIELGRLDRYEMLMPLMQQHEKCVYAFGQRNGDLFETLTLTAQSEEVAKQTKKVLEGLIAYEELWAAGSEPLAKLMENVELSRDGIINTVNWKGGSGMVTAAFDDLKDRTDQWMQLLAPQLFDVLQASDSADQDEDMTRSSGERRSRQSDVSMRQRARERRMENRPWLGAMIIDSPEAGVEVARIYLNSPADKAGLEVGDRIMQIDGDEVSSSLSVAGCIRRMEPGKTVDIVIQRDGQKQTLEVEVGDLEDFHERLFGQRFRQRFEDFHGIFDPDFDGLPEGVFTFRIPSDQDRDLTPGELLQEVRDALREFREEFQESDSNGRKSSSKDKSEKADEEEEDDDDDENDDGDDKDGDDKKAAKKTRAKD